MSSIVYLTNKKNGTTYVYVNEKVRSKSDDGYTYRRRCIGHVDPETGQVVENRTKVPQEDPAVVSVGIDMFLSKLSEDAGLKSALRMAFPQDWRLILTCAMYILSENAPLSFVDNWSNFNRTPFGRAVEPRDLEALLSAIDTDAQEAFMRIWRKRNPGDSIVLFSDYPGYSEEDTSGSIVSSPGINSVPSEIAVCFGRDSGAPISYVWNSVPSRGPESVSDTVDRMYWIGSRPMVVMDRTYPSSIIEGIRDRGFEYLISLPNDSASARRAIGDVKDVIVDSSNLVTLPDGGHGFVMSPGRAKGTRSIVYYNEEDAERDMGMFFTQVDVCRNELEQGTFVPTHVPFYTRFFRRRGGAGTAGVEVNTDRMMEYASSAGYLVMLTDTKISSEEAVDWNGRMSECASFFSKVRNPVDSPRLKLFSQHNYSSRLFVQFVAYILHSLTISNLTSGSLRMEFTVQSALREMGSLMQVSGMGYKKPRTTKTNFRQEILMKNAGLK